MIGVLKRWTVTRARRLWTPLPRSFLEAGRSTPLCSGFGYGRGTPIDRRYVEEFLATNAGDIRGHVLEIGDDAYSKRFGNGRIDGQDVLNVDDSNGRATIVGDISQDGVLPAQAFDCIIFTQTLQFIYEASSALSQLHRSLRSGGVLLLTVPGISPAGLDRWEDYWSFRTDSLRRLLSGPFEPEQVDISSRGNLFAATAFLHGAAQEEVESAKLEPVDPSYPLVLTARAQS